MDTTELLSYNQSHQHKSVQMKLVSLCHCKIMKAYQLMCLVKTHFNLRDIICQPATTAY